MIIVDGVASEYSTLYGIYGYGDSARDSVESVEREKLVKKVDEREEIREKNRAAGGGPSQRICVSRSKAYPTTDHRPHESRS